MYAMDHRLIQSAAGGSQAAFSELVGPHLELGYRLAVTMLGDPNTAEDMVQEATLKAWRNLPRFNADTRVRAWFLTVVANQCRSQRRGRWWRVLKGLEPAVIETGVEAPGADLDLHRALMGLDPEDRAAVFLRYYEDLPMKEVATALGISFTAARSRVHRALRKLRLELDDKTKEQLHHE